VSELGQKRKRGSSYNRDAIEKLRKLRDLQTILKRSDIENAYVTNPGSETTSETTSNVIAEDMLDSLNREKVSMRDFDIVSKSPQRRSHTRRTARPAKRNPKAKRIIRRRAKTRRPKPKKHKRR